MRCHEGYGYSFYWDGKLQISGRNGLVWGIGAVRRPLLLHHKSLEGLSGLSNSFCLAVR